MYPPPFRFKPFLYITIIRYIQLYVLKTIAVHIRRIIGNFRSFACRLCLQIMFAIYVCKLCLQIDFPSGAYAWPGGDQAKYPRVKGSGALPISPSSTHLLFSNKSLRWINYNTKVECYELYFDLLKLIFCNFVHIFGLPVREKFILQEIWKFQRIW